MTQADKLLDAARSEIGVKESPANSNKVKYNTWYYGSEVSGSKYPWCSVFVLWCFYKASLLKLTFSSLAEARRAYIEGARNWKTLADRKKQWVTEGYRPGDVVLFDWTNDGIINHVGIVESLSSIKGMVNTIEGNTGVASDSSGGGVMRRSRDIKYIIGAFRPAYITIPEVSTWAKSSWEWAQSVGLCDGTRPKDKATREEVVSLLHRFSQMK